MPEYAAAVDVYSNVNGPSYLHIQEYRAPADIPPETARHRLRRIGAEIDDDLLELRRLARYRNVSRDVIDDELNARG